MRAILILLLFCSPLHAEPITAISWNTESGGSDPAIIANELDFAELDAGPAERPWKTKVKCSRNAEIC